MKKRILLYVTVSAIFTLILSCSKEDTCVTDNNDDQFRVSINYSSTRALSDQVQGGGKYSEGELVSLFTTGLKFTAEASGSAGGTWLSDDPQSRVTLTSGINQDWSVTIKDYYCDVTFDNTALGGDGTIETVAMKFGEQLPMPMTISGYTFEGWYDGDVKIVTVPNSRNITLTGKFEEVKFVALSYDWHIISPFGIAQMPELSQWDWKYLAYGNGRYVVGHRDGYVSMSTDGITWSTPKKIDSELENKYVNITDVSFVNGRFFVLNRYYHYYTSVDGVTWTKMYGPNNTRCITYGDGKYIMAGEQGYIVTLSEDFVTLKSQWIKENLDDHWDAIAYGNGKFVLFSNKCQVSSSIDGINWTGIKDTVLGRGNSIFNATYGNGKFVAVAGSENILLSDDGEWWEHIKSDKTVSWMSITFGKGTFQAGCSNGIIKFSQDGKNWITGKQLRDNSGNPMSTIVDICAMP